MTPVTPPADIAEQMPAYLAALEALALHVADVRDTWRPLVKRYNAWVDEDENRSTDWLTSVEAALGMDRASELAGVVEHLADWGLVPGGANQLASDEAEMVLGEIRADASHTPSAGGGGGEGGDADPDRPVLCDIKRLTIDPSRPRCRTAPR
jgi:hypothetical protein